MRRHDFDAIAFVGGLLALAGAVFYQLDAEGLVDVDARWGAALGLIAVGLAGLATALRSRSDEPPPGAAE